MICNVKQDTVSDIKTIDSKNIHDRRHIEAYRIWKKLAGLKKAPRAIDWDVCKFAATSIAHLAMLDVERNGDMPPRFTFSMWGHELSYMFGQDLTNMTIHDFNIAPCRRHFEIAIKMISERCLPIFTASKFCFPNRSFMLSERIGLPWLDDTGEISRVLILNTFILPHNQELPLGFPTSVMHKVDYVIDASDEFMMDGSAILHHYVVDWDDEQMADAG